MYCLNITKMSNFFEQFFPDDENWIFYNYTTRNRSWSKKNDTPWTISKTRFLCVHLIYTIRHLRTIVCSNPCTIFLTIKICTPRKDVKRHWNNSLPRKINNFSKIELWNGLVDNKRSSNAVIILSNKVINKYNILVLKFFLKIATNIPDNPTHGVN